MKYWSYPLKVNNHQLYCIFNVEISCKMHQSIGSSRVNGLISHGITRLTTHWTLTVAPEQGTSAPLPSSCWLCHLCLCSLTLLTVTDKMSMWMYANVIFVVHYSLKDRSWTISFPFMRLPCWPAEWRYSNYSFPGCPLPYTGCAFNDAALLPSVKEKLPGI